MVGGTCGTFGCLLQNLHAGLHHVSVASMLRTHGPSKQDKKRGMVEELSKTSTLGYKGVNSRKKRGFGGCDLARNESETDVEVEIDNGLDEVVEAEDGDEEELSAAITSQKEFTSRRLAAAEEVRRVRAACNQERASALATCVELEALMGSANERTRGVARLAIEEIRAEATKEEDAMASLDALLSADLQAETDALSQYKAPILAQQRVDELDSEIVHLERELSTKKLQRETARDELSITSARSRTTVRLLVSTTKALEEEGQADIVEVLAVEA